MLVDLCQNPCGYATALRGRGLSMTIYGLFFIRKTHFSLYTFVPHFETLNLYIGTMRYEFNMIVSRSEFRLFPAVHLTHPNELISLVNRFDPMMVLRFGRFWYISSPKIFLFTSDWSKVIGIKVGGKNGH